MTIDNLWEKLPLPASQLSTFKKDIAEGKVPELPFFIIGQPTLKASVKNKLEQIDSDRMLTNLVIADYGNGKTNLLKYLQLFFRTHKLGINVEYSRADVERTDLVLFLLKIIQDKYITELVRLVNEINEEKLIASFVNNYESNFREIEQYTRALFADGNSEEDILEILYFGTGRYSNKRYFDKRNLEQIHDFNRREILVLFLNILAHNNKFIVFAIDEIEKIREKSKIRFNHFLTSYRELVDLFNQIKGHYLLVSFTTGVGESEISTANDALYTRIKPDILQVEPLSKKDDILELIEYLNELFDTQKNTTDVLNTYWKNKAPNNRLAIQNISSILYKEHTNETLTEILQKADLVDIYKETEERLDEEEAFKNIHRKFFDPFEFYLEATESNGTLKKQERLYIDTQGEKVNYFIFSTYLEDFQNEKLKIEKLLSDYPNYLIVILTPEKLELTFTALELKEDERVDLLDYDPQELLILLEMFRDNYDLQPLLIDIIADYTRQKL